MDGIRGFWDGNRLLSRQGNVINAPIWFTDKIPGNISLDGELWLGKGTSLENLMAVINSKNSDWSAVGYYIYDLPDSPGVYQDRMKQMEELKTKLPNHVRIVESTKCNGRHHLEKYLDNVLEKQGEGVVVRDPQSLYVKGWTNSLLKVKVLNGELS